LNNILRIVLLALVIVLAACSTQQYISETNPAVLRDTIFSVEPRNNGTYTIWMVHDDIGAYCTADKTIGEQALQAVRGKSATVVMTYRYRQAGDREYAPYTDSGCAIEGTKYTGVTVYKILSIEILGE
jgi:hypothetical protein